MRVVCYLPRQSCKAFLSSFEQNSIFSFMKPIFSLNSSKIQFYARQNSIRKNPVFRY